VVSRVLQDLKYIRLWLAIGAGLVALVVWLSLTPDPIDIGGKVEGVNSGHFVAYLVLMLWFGQLLRPLRAKLVAAALFVLMGVALEYVQDLTPFHRTFAYTDMRDDAFGVAAGLALGFTALGRSLAWLEARRGG